MEFLQEQKRSLEEDASANQEVCVLDVSKVRRNKTTSLHDQTAMALHVQKQHREMTKFLFI